MYDMEIWCFAPFLHNLAVIRLPVAEETCSTDGRTDERKQSY